MHEDGRDRDHPCRRDVHRPVISDPDPMKTIEVLNPAVQACIRKRGFTSLSDAQQQAIPLIHGGNHIVLIAPTGTGKTESAMFPVFNGLLSLPAGGGFKALYITPLRSLNRDMLSRMQWWCSELGPHGRCPARGYSHGGAAEAGTPSPGPPDHHSRDLPGPVHGKAAAEAPRAM